MTPVYQAPIWIPVIAVFVFMFVMNEVGYRLGKSRDADEPERSRPVTGTLKTTVMGLVALLMGFTYAMASNRFDNRQRLVVDEANAIGTCDLRARLLAEPAKSQIRTALRRYTELRIDRFEHALDPGEYDRIEAAMHAALMNLWSGVEDGVKADKELARTIELVPAANTLIDVSALDNWANHTRVPTTVLGLLAICMVVSSAIVGHWSGQVGRRHFWLWTTMNILVVLVFFMVLDYDRPRRGFIRVSQQPLVELLEQLKR
jgi:hypothetical protein